MNQAHILSKLRNRFKRCHRRIDELKCDRAAAIHRAEKATPPYEPDLSGFNRDINRLKQRAIEISSAYPSLTRASTTVYYTESTLAVA